MHMICFPWSPGRLLDFIVQPRILVLFRLCLLARSVVGTSTQPTSKQPDNALCSVDIPNTKNVYRSSTGQYIPLLLPSSFYQYTFRVAFHVVQIVQNTHLYFRKP